MNKPTFKAIEHKVNLALCLVATLIAVGLAFSNSATAKSMVNSEYEFLENYIEVKVNAAKVNCDLAEEVAFEKCIADAESMKHISKFELIAQRKAVVGTPHDSKSSANSAKLEIHRNIKPSNTNTMPVIDELNPAFKKSRLI